LSDIQVEFPRIDERYALQPHRHGWFVSGSANTNVGDASDRASIAHVDTHIGATALWRPEAGDFAGEPVFVPRDADAKEGEGWVLSVVYRGASHRSDLIVLDALDITRGPVAAYVAVHSEVVAGQYILIAVSDTGVGMDAATAAQAFEPFFTTKPAGHGTGLGLSQVYGFVKQSRGHVKIYSEVDVGTTVKIYLPRLLATGELPEETLSAPLPGPAQAEIILVVEDDEDVRSTTVDALEELGYRVLQAADGPAALRALESEPRVHLLFTDVVLPGGMTGAQVAAEARGLRPNLKVLFTTGYARNAIVHHGRLDAGVHLITKPFSFDELSTRIRSLLDGSSP
jgi:CheY-like chemotaxis protein